MKKNEKQENDVLLEDDEEELPEVEQELSKVATNPKQSIFIVAVVGLVFVYLFFNYVLNSENSDEGADVVQVPTQVSRPVAIAASSPDLPSIPALPEPPQLEDPSLPPPPPINYDSPEVPTLPVTGEPIAPPRAADPTELASGLLPAPGNITAPTLPISTSTTSDSDQRRKDQKRKAPVVLIAGAPQTKTPDEIEQEANFKYRGDMNLVLARGKVMDAVIETAISTDFGGEIRAVIVRDIYSEWGRNILIPKGSKIFGNYQAGIEGLYGRIEIEWTQIDLINGYSVNFTGNYATDSLGRKGVPGRLDNKFKERFTNAVLNSMFNIQLAKHLDSFVKPQISSQAAASQNAQATSIRNLANSANTSVEAEALNVRVNLCANTLNAITDKTSSAFTTINTACQDLQTQSNGSTDLQKLTSIKNIINAAADTLIQVTSQSTESTKAQKASEQAFKDISGKVTELIDEQEFKPTITVEQGTKIKIYVNKDYRFPKVAVGRTRMMK